jgi:beta-glucosidase
MMWLAQLALLVTSLVQPSSQQNGNSTAPFPSATYPNATSPNPAASVDASFSPPYYPSPWGTGAGEWASAYAKAKAFVSQLTLIEKVNLTTGVGYVERSYKHDQTDLMSMQMAG